jgi:hypothetical protein
VGRLLAEQFERGVHLEGDFFRRSIVSGRSDLTPTASEDAFDQLRLRYEISARAADAYAENGFLVVLEDVVAGDMLLDMVQIIAARPLRIVVLMPSLAATAERETGRSTMGYENWTIGDLYDVFLNSTPRIGLWLDTSDQTPAATVAAILAAPPEQLEPGASTDRARPKRRPDRAGSDA